MLKGFLQKLFPPDLVAYIPGQKLIVAALAYGVAALLGVSATESTSIFGVPVDVGLLIAAVAAYMWPSDAIQV